MILDAGAWDQFMTQVDACGFVNAYDPNAPSGQFIDKKVQKKCNKDVKWT